MEKVGGACTPRGTIGPHQLVQHLASLVLWLPRPWDSATTKST